FLRIHMSFFLTPCPSRSPLFPYTTLFRSYNPDLLLCVAGLYAPHLQWSQEIQLPVLPAKLPPQAQVGHAQCQLVALLFRVPFSRSEEHTSELQSRFDLVCRLLLEKTKNII